jgi:hypothetical protein
MNLSAVIGVAIGLAFMYLLLSMICSTLQEWGAAVVKRRAAYLRKGLAALLNDRGLEGLKETGPAVSQLLAHPIIESLMTRSLVKDKAEQSSLSYLPARNFVVALLETFAAGVLAPGADVEAELQKLEVRDANATILPEQTRALKASLLGLARRANNDREKFLEGAERWYDDTMDRVSGWYKRHTQVVVIILAVLVTLILNINTITVGKGLYEDAGLRDAISAAAEAYLATHQRPVAVNDTTASATTTDTTATTTTVATTTVDPKQEDAAYQKRLNDQVDELNSLNLPIGWRWQTPADANKPDAEKGLPTSLWSAIGEALCKPATWLGWLLTVIALSLGAPFWFDMLMKVVNVRTNGPKPARGADTPK